MTVLWFPISRNAKISYPCVSRFIKDDVLWFDISVDDVSLMKVVETFDEAPDQKF